MPYPTFTETAPTLSTVAATPTISTVLSIPTVQSAGPEEIQSLANLAVAGTPLYTPGDFRPGYVIPDYTNVVQPTDAELIAAAGRRGIRTIGIND